MEHIPKIKEKQHVNSPSFLKAWSELRVHLLGPSPQQASISLTLPLKSRVFGWWMLFKALTNRLGFSAGYEELAQDFCHRKMGPGLGSIPATLPVFLWDRVCNWEWTLCSSALTWAGHTACQHKKQGNLAFQLLTQWYPCCQNFKKKFQTFWRISPLFLSHSSTITFYRVFLPLCPFPFPLAWNQSEWWPKKQQMS